MFFKIGLLKNFTNFTGKLLCWTLFLIKLQLGLQLYLKKEFAKFLRTPFFTEHLRWQLLKETESFYKGDAKVFLKTKELYKGDFRDPN